MSKEPKPRHVLGGEATARRFARENAEIRARVRQMRDQGGLTFEEIGRVLAITRQWACAIYHKGAA